VIGLVAYWFIGLINQWTIGLIWASYTTQLV